MPLYATVCSTDIGMVTCLLESLEVEIVSSICLWRQLEMLPTEYSHLQ